MMSPREIRECAYRVVTADRRRWFGRLALTAIVFGSINFVVKLVFKTVYQLTDVSDFETYVQSCREAGRAVNLDAGAALHVVGASALMFLAMFIIEGATSLGTSRVALRAARDKSDSWFSGVLAGFKDPLGMIWLTLCLALRVFAGLLLFIVPGVMMAYSYRQAWFFKSEYPDWSAGRCIDASSALMKGRRMNLFKMDLSYLGLSLIVIGAGVAAILLAAALGSVGQVLGRANVALFGLLAAAVALVAGVGIFVASLFVGAYWSVGKAIFYIEALGAPEEGEEVNGEN